MITIKNELYVLMFLLGLLLFNWPLLTISDNWGVLGQFVYLFLIWIILILFVFLIGGVRQKVSVKQKKDSMVIAEKKES